MTYKERALETAQKFYPSKSRANERVVWLSICIEEALKAQAAETRAARDAEWADAIVPGSANTTVGEFVSDPTQVALFLVEQRNLEREAATALACDAIKKYLVDDICTSVECECTVKGAQARIREALAPAAPEAGKEGKK